MAPSLLTRHHTMMFSAAAPIIVMFTFFSMAISPSLAASETVQKVCNQTVYYRYCVAALYSDPRTPNADPYFLAYISFGLAYLNATNSADYFSHAVSSTKPHHQKLAGSLSWCQDGYRRAASTLFTAYDVLNSKSFDKLGGVSTAAGAAADGCSFVMKKLAKMIPAAQVPVSGLMALQEVRNRDMKRLSEICTVISKLLLRSSSK